METNNPRVRQLSWMAAHDLPERMERTLDSLGHEIAAKDNHLCRLLDVLRSQALAYEATLNLVHEIAKDRMSAEEVVRNA